MRVQRILAGTQAQPLLIQSMGITYLTSVKENCQMENGLLIKFGLDGNAWYAHFDDFTNLQESVCGFGPTPQHALEDLVQQDPVRFREVEENSQGVK